MSLIEQPRLPTAAGVLIDGAAPPSAAVQWGVETGLATQGSDRIARLTLRGRLASNELFRRLLPG